VSVCRVQSAGESDCQSEWWNWIRPPSLDAPPPTTDVLVITSLRSFTPFN
jgi:hypothetical protein